MRTIVALYDDFARASEAVEALVSAGYDRDNISVLTADPSGEYANQLQAQKTSDEVAENAAAGAVSGGALGGAIGVILGLGALAIPGIGPVVAAGPLVAGLVGAGVGAVTGGILGTLVDWGVPREEAAYYYEGVRRGGALVVVTAISNQVDSISEILDDYDPVNIKRRSAYWRDEGWMGYQDEEEAYTATELGDRDLDRQRYTAYEDDSYYDYEPAYYRHYQANYGATNYPYSYYTPAYRYGYSLSNDEQYRDYDDWTTLEPVARRNWEAENDTVWDDVKDAVRQGWNELRAEWNEMMADRGGFMNVGLYDRYETAYRRHFNSNYERHGRDYDYYAPAYRYGYVLANDYREYDNWLTLEPVARRDWEKEHDTLWDDVKDAVQHGWEQVRGERHEVTTKAADPW